MVSRALAPLCTVYQEDIIMHSMTTEEHLDHEWKVLRALGAMAITTKLFMSTVVLFDGYMMYITKVVQPATQLVELFSLHTLYVSLGMVYHFCTFLKND